MEPDSVVGPWTPDDEAALQAASVLALRGVGWVEPNPRVGAVLYRGREILAEGWHREWGEAHAERDLLSRWEGPVPEDVSVAVTLEPCSSHGKQPPCGRLLRERGVRRVVVGEVDPDPRHAGRALVELRDAGIEVIEAPTGVVSADQLAEFRSYLQSDRPMVLLKWATSLDGHWAPPPAEGAVVSGPEAHREVHRLRAHVDGILVGSGTALHDDPLLTARPPGRRSLVRIVLDARGRLTPSSRLVESASEESPVWQITEGDDRLQRPGLRVLVVSSTKNLREEVLPLLRSEGIQRLMVEGGPTITSAFLREGCADRAWVFVAPSLLGVAGGPGAGLGWAPGRHVDVSRPIVEEVRTCGSDAWFRLRLSSSRATE